MKRDRRNLGWITLAAGLLVGPAAIAAETNDFFTNAVTVTVGVTQVANNADATAETDEPKHAFLTAEHSLWWKWTAPSSARMLAHTEGSSFDTALAVYTNNPGQPFGVGEVDSNRNKSGFEVTSWVFFNAFAGTTYYFAVDGEFGSTGNARFTLVPGVIQGVSFAVLDYQTGQAFSSSVTLTNPANVTLVGHVLGPTEGGNLEFLSGANRIFTRFFSQELNPEFVFHWKEIPLGHHEFSARYDTASIVAYVVDVVGSRVGFKSYTNVATAVSSSATPVSGALWIQNLTGSATGPLRVSLLKSTTNYRRAGTPDQPAAEAPMLEFSPVNLPSLAPGSATNVVISNNLNISCPSFGGGFSEDGIQHHVRAILEEHIGTGWAVVDRATLVSSFPDVLFPPNQGVNGKEAPTNNAQYSYLTGLGITGPLSVEEGGGAAFAANATNSLNESGVVAPTWSVPPPHAIAADGTFTAGTVATDTQVALVAIFQRSIFSISATQLVQIVNVPAPQLQPPAFDGANFSFVLSGAPNKQHVIESSSNLVFWVPIATNSTDANGNRQFSFGAPPNQPTYFFRASIGH